jgi:hypothetical protein
MAGDLMQSLDVGNCIPQIANHTPNRANHYRPSKQTAQKCAQLVQHNFIQKPNMIGRVLRAQRERSSSYVH